jgi:ribonuclease D
MTESTNSDYLFIENETDLRRIALEFQEEKALGVDLEGDSMFHYQEKVCLLQISTPERNVLIDPLSVKDLSPLRPVFSDSRIRKVLHGADYDIRSLYRDFGIEVRSLFDTQIAARFLGVRETGLASLLKEKFNILSDKKYQKKDWSQRPLPAAMLRYAVQDTSHLLPLVELLERELIEKGLLFCVEEESELLSGVRPNSIKNKAFFLNFKGAGRLDSRSLAVLENILRFRDQVARRRDCPHFKVLGNESIKEIVQVKPISRADLAGIKGFSPKMMDRMGDSLIEKVKEGLNISDDTLPVYPHISRQKLRSKEATRVKALKSWREQLGGKWRVDPAVVFTNSQIRAISIANPGGPESMECIEDIRKWQIKLFGSGICNVLQETG